MIDLHTHIIPNVDDGANSFDDALKIASENEGCTIEELNYQVIEEKKGLFSKKVVIETYGIVDVIKFAKEYLLNIIENYDLEGTVSEKFENGIIHLTIDTNHNSILSYLLLLRYLYFQMILKVL